MILATGRVIIVGAGLAALSAALRLAPHPTLVVSPEPLGTGASSAWAQGGVAAAMDAEDSVAAHAADTIRAGAGIVDEAVATLVTALAPDHVRDLTRLGAPFDRGHGGSYLMSREAAHSWSRVVRIQGDQAGREIMRTLIRAARAEPAIQILEGVTAARLEHQAGRVTGVWITRAEPPSAQILVRGPAVLLAAGGASGLYAVTTNPPAIRGEALGMAARAGAVIADAEFLQFHPTAIATGEDPAPLATEALRGEGAILVNAEAKRFMAALHPDAELAPRDIVARAIHAEERAGRRPALDTRGVLGGPLTERFPAVAAACARAGIDPASEPIPVTVAAHYHMGGVATDTWGRTSLAGLWACGEAACTGLHGANRLASNGLLEALVVAGRAAEDIAGTLGPIRAAAMVEPQFAPGGAGADAEAVAALRQVMTAQVGVLRDADGLSRALARIGELEAAAPPSDAYSNMLACARMIATAALLRRESRGGHFRTDFPQTDPAQASRSRLTLAAALAAAPKTEPA